MSCCVAGTNGSLDLKCCAFALCGQVSADRSRCAGSMARRSGEYGSFATKIKRMDACKYRKVVRRCRTQASGDNQQGVVDGRVNEAAVSSVAPDRSPVLFGCVYQDQGGGSRRCCSSTQPEPASRLKSATRDVSFLRSDSKCWRYGSDLSSVTPR